MSTYRDELGQCKFIVVIPNRDRLTSVCPFPYCPVRGDVLSHLPGQLTRWSKSTNEIYYRFDSSYYITTDFKPFNYYWSKQELFELQRDGIIILLKNIS